DGGPMTVPPANFPLEAERWPLILRDARRLLGRPHHLSVHPGGVVITPRPTEEYVPVQRAAKGVLITQFEKDAAEATGLVKIDLLGNGARANVDEIAWSAGVRARGVSPRSEGSATDEFLRELTLPARQGNCAFRAERASERARARAGGVSPRS